MVPAIFFSSYASTYICTSYIVFLLLLLFYYYDFFFLFRVFVCSHKNLLRFRCNCKLICLAFGLNKIRLPASQSGRQSVIMLLSSTEPPMLLMDNFLWTKKQYFQTYSLHMQTHSHTAWILRRAYWIAISQKKKRKTTRLLFFSNGLLRTSMFAKL